MKPLITFGLPVYNSAAHEPLLHRALNSLLAQTCSGVEIVISDNGSQDRTGEICREYAREHSSIRYHRFSCNYGVVNNVRQVVRMAQGEYFTLAGDDDCWHPGFAERLVQRLEQTPDAVVAMCRVEQYTPAGELLDILGFQGIDCPENQSRLVLAMALLRKRGPSGKKVKNNLFVKGVFRSRIFKGIILGHRMPVVNNNERELLCEAALAGRFLYLDECLLHKNVWPRSFVKRNSSDPLVLQKRAQGWLRQTWLLTLRLGRSRILTVRDRLLMVPVLADHCLRMADLRCRRLAEAVLPAQLQQLIKAGLTCLRRLRGPG